MLGGDDLRTLYICTAVTHVARKAAELRAGRIEAARVNVPGSGRP
jgi:sugar lactone lactonase YvrE